MSAGTDSRKDNTRWTVSIVPSHTKGKIYAPPSKSMMHRLLICAGLAGGTSRIHQIAASEDIEATIDCLRALGAGCVLTSDEAVVTGTNVFSVPDHPVLPCRECASTMRFMIPLALLSGKNVVLTGSRRLMRRPLAVYEELFDGLGLCFDRCGQISQTEFEDECEAIRLQGPLGPGEYTIPGYVSSQFVSGLLFALPLLESGSVLHLHPPVVSRPYIEMTIAAMKMFGVEVEKTDELTFQIPGGQAYQPCDTAVEGDWSNAAAFLAMGLDVDGLDSESLQGDRCCVQLFEQLRRGFAEIDITDCPDLGPVLFAFAALNHGGRFVGTRRLRDKESDRIAAMAEELAKFGVETMEEENAFTVGTGGGTGIGSGSDSGYGSGGSDVSSMIRAPHEPLSGHGDHRIVMALAVLCTRTGGTIIGAEAVTKSFPDFFDKLYEAGVSLSIKKNR